MFLIGVLFIYFCIGVMFLSYKFIQKSQRDTIQYVVAKIVYSAIFMGITFCCILFYALYAFFYNQWNFSAVLNVLALLFIRFLIEKVYMFFELKDSRGLTINEKHVSNLFAVLGAVFVCMMLGRAYKEDAYIDLSYIMIGILMGEYFSISAIYDKGTIRKFLNDVKSNFAKVKVYVWITGIIFIFLVLFLATRNKIAVCIKEYFSEFFEGVMIGVVSAGLLILIVEFFRRKWSKRKMSKKAKVWIKKPNVLVNIFKVFVSLIFMGLAVLRVAYPELNIDVVTIILIILAMFPWYSQNIKALELNGIGKVELVSDKEKEELEEKVAKVRVSQNVLKENPAERYSFYNLRYTDQKLALAGLRIEIEKELMRIAKGNQISCSNIGLGKLTELLSKEELITHNELNLIRDIIGVLNKAVHSQLDDYKDADFNWVFELGLDVLESLKQR